MHDSGGNSVEEEARSRRRRSLLAILVLLLAVMCMGFVLLFDGIDLATRFLERYLGEREAPVTEEEPIDPDAPTSEEIETAKYIYAEQIESQVNLRKLADGEVEFLELGAVSIADNDALMDIRATFTDGTSAPGAVWFARLGETWYFRTITGLRPEVTEGSADTVQAAEEPRRPLTADEKLLEVGVRDPDEGVLTTLANSQAVNRPVIAGLVAAEYTRIDIGRPEDGAQTVSIPVTMTLVDGSSVEAVIVMITKTVEYRERVFLTAFTESE